MRMAVKKHGSIDILKVLFYPLSLYIHMYIHVHPVFVLSICISVSDVQYVSIYQIVNIFISYDIEFWVYQYT